MLKKIGLGLAVLAVVIAAASWYVYSNVDSYVKAAIEKYASEATQTAVRVDSVNISLTTGEGTISGLTVGNPKGYSNANAISVGTIVAQIDVASLRGEGPIVVRKIEVERPQVSYELNGAMGNLQVLQKNAAAYAAQFKTSGEARKQIINDLTIKGGSVTASSPQLQGKSLNLPLPAIRLRDIGKSTGGATPAQVVGQVVNAVTHEAQKVAAGALQRQITSMIGKEAVGALPGAADGDVTNQLKDLLGK